jgi:type II secretory pathway component PulJ
MNRRSRRRGATLIEALVACLITGIIGSALVVLVQSTLASRFSLAGQNATYATVQKSLNILMDNLRTAQTIQIQTSPALYAALSAASSSSVTCYTDSAGDTLRLWLDTSTSPATLKETRTVSGVATTTQVLLGVQSLQFTYYVVAGSAYTAPSASWTTTASSHAPTSAELPTIGAINIAVTVTLNGYTRQLSGFVRLRNSPYTG